MYKFLILTLISLFGINIHSQSMDTLGFWNQSVKPLIDQDFKAMEEVILFPLEGEWGFLMQLDKPEKEWTKEDFLFHYDNLFNDSVKQNLSNPKNIVISFFQEEILVNFGLITAEKTAFGIILRYKSINHIWKLHCIQALGG